MANLHRPLGGQNLGPSVGMERGARTDNPHRRESQSRTRLSLDSLVFVSRPQHVRSHDNWAVDKSTWMHSEPRATRAGSAGERPAPNMASRTSFRQTESSSCPATTSWEAGAEGAHTFVHTHPLLAGGVVRSALHLLTRLALRVRKQSGFVQQAGAGSGQKHRMAGAPTTPRGSARIGKLTLGARMPTANDGLVLARLGCDDRRGSSTSIESNRLGLNPRRHGGEKANKGPERLGGKDPAG
ncbi:hypothetical protein RJ55_02763 [Drechmeria coniospora]|nr:hypothetical protein RJ55_02763 [Drechmeria coniospora]